MSIQPMASASGAEAQAVPVGHLTKRSLPNLTLAPPARVSGQPTEFPPCQRDVIGLKPGHGPVLLLGAPGTGKSTVLVEAAATRVQRDGVDPSGVLLLAPSRLAGARLRDALSARLDRSLGASPVRTWSSYAFDLIRRARSEGWLPHLSRPPRLLSGPEQDLIISELLAGHRKGVGSAIDWPEELHEALQTRGFRQELRQLFDRVIEYGCVPADLKALGTKHGRADWQAAAQLFAEYRDHLDLRMPEAFDPAGVITAARQVLLDAPEFLAQERGRLKLILVDDLQEANAAVYELLAVLAEDLDVIAAACPDTVVQGFRGARPDLLAKLPQLLGRNVPFRRMALTVSHRMPADLAERWRSVAGRIGYVSGAGEARMLRNPGHPAGADRPAASVHVVESPAHEQRYVAQRILEAQLEDGIPLEDMAVIVRTGAHLARLARYLDGQGILSLIPVAENPVRDEAAVRPLLDAYAMALDPDHITAERASDLLTSRIGGASSVDVRRIRQALRRRELLAGGGRSSDALLVDALRDPAGLEILGWEVAPARRVARMLAAGTEAAGRPGANAESVLWALWSAAGLSDRWAAQALDGGASGMRADRDLDAIMALFETAERYVDQLPGSSAAQFLEYLVNQELPMDTLARRAQRAGAVELLTPAGAAGREWQLVIVAGVQEGVWPNTRLRGELLGSTDFVDAMEQSHQHRPEQAGISSDPVGRLRDIRYDELRSFSTAVSRAGRRLICVAVRAEDAEPSQFLDLVDPWEDVDSPRPTTEVLRPMTLRALTAELRQFVQQPETLPGAAADAARTLARLAAESVPVRGANPADWWGLLPLSSEAPIVPDGLPVPVSPSKVEAVTNSPLDWFVQAAGGEVAGDLARSLGSLVHGIAQDLPNAAGTEYVEELVRRWPQLGKPDTWESRTEFRRAEAMVRKLAEYVLDMRRGGRTLLAVEQDFSVTVSGSDRPIEIRGQIDRLELDSEGRAFVVDLKTGRNAPHQTDLERHAQLGTYQAAILAGALDDLPDVPTSAGPGGAALVQLGTGVRNVKVQQQVALSPETDWATPVVLEAAALMSAATFESRHDPRRSGRGGYGCRLPEICPLCPEGRQVTE